MLGNFTSGSVSGLNITGYNNADYVASLSNSGVLSFASAIPEPATCATLLGAMGLGFSLWRRRRS